MKNTKEEEIEEVRKSHTNGIDKSDPEWAAFYEKNKRRIKEIFEKKYNGSYIDYSDAIYIKWSMDWQVDFRDGWDYMRDFFCIIYGHGQVHTPSCIGTFQRHLYVENAVCCMTMEEKYDCTIAQSVVIAMNGM